MELRSGVRGAPATCHKHRQAQPFTSGTLQSGLSCVVHWSIDLQIDRDIKNNFIEHFLLRLESVLLGLISTEVHNPVTACRLWVKDVYSKHWALITVSFCICKPGVRVLRAEKALHCKTHWSNGEKVLGYSISCSVAAVVCACITRCGTLSVPSLSEKRRCMLPSPVWPFTFISHLSSCNIRDSPKASKICPLVQVEAAHLVCVLAEGHLFQMGA